MGDRGNIAIIQHPGGDDREVIFFYGHWSGYRIKEATAKALERGQSRWGDEPYLARILFCELLAGSGEPEVLAETTGFGITTYLTDNEYPIVVVDDRQGLVFEVDESVAKDRKALFEHIDNVANGVPFGAFIEANAKV